MTQTSKVAEDEVWLFGGMWPVDVSARSPACGKGSGREVRQARLQPAPDGARHSSGPARRLLPPDESGARRHLDADHWGRIRSWVIKHSLVAPPAASRTDRRTAGLLARGVSPTPPSRARSPVTKMRRHAAHSRGGGRGSASSLPRSLFTLELARDRAGLMSQLRKGLSNDRHDRLASQAGTHPQPGSGGGRRPDALQGLQCRAA